MLSANIASNEVMIMERFRLRGREMFHKLYVLHHNNKNSMFSPRVVACHGYNDDVGYYVI